MRIWALRVSLPFAEDIRRLLQSAGLIHPDARIYKQGEHIFIPITEYPDSYLLTSLEKDKTLLADITIIEAEFKRKSQKPSLEDMLGFSPAFDVIGDIAVINSQDPNAEKIAKALINFRKSIKVVLGTSSPVSGEFRTRDFAVLAGENRTHTIHTEYGCRYKVDLARAYFSPRLGTERKRIADTVISGQSVVDMFAGVGPFSILIGKNVLKSRVVAVDRNPAAVQLLRENIRLNHLNNVTTVEDDVRHAAEELKHSADHVIMNLPHSAREFLDSGLIIARNGGLVHFYDITPKADLYKMSWALIQKAALRQGKNVECFKKRIVRSYAPYQYNVCIEFHVHDKQDF
jgi:tRNA (guanine37-N1)-methyltransferase